MRFELVLGPVARPVAFLLLVTGAGDLALDLLGPGDRTWKRHDVSPCAGAGRTGSETGGGSGRRPGRRARVRRSEGACARGRCPPPPTRVGGSASRLPSLPPPG